MIVRSIFQDHTHDTEAQAAILPFLHYHKSSKAPYEIFFSSLLLTYDLAML